MFFSKLSRYSELQNPTVKPLYIVKESFEIGFPDREQNLFIAFLLNIFLIL